MGGHPVKIGDQGDNSWAAAPPPRGSFVCNLRDRLDRMAGGRCCAALYRVAIDTSGRDHVSIPRFFDPNLDARMQLMPGGGPAMDNSGKRWDGANLQAFEWTYGDRVTAKVGKEFPELKRAVQSG